MEDEELMIIFILFPLAMYDVILVLEIEESRKL